MSIRELSLRVRETDPNLVGKKIVAVDIDTKKTLGLNHGDFVSIKGKRETLAQVWPARPLDEGSQIIRLDSFSRKNAGVSLGESVIVKRIETKPAAKIILAPLEPLKFNGTGYNRLLKKQYLGKPVIGGEELIFSVFGSPIVLNIHKSIPKGPVHIDDGTDIELLETPVEPDSIAVSRVSYEDIGGLKKQIKKVREMIELPLKHPELFQKLGVDPPKGILMHGPPGTGKTMLAKAVSNEADAHFILINGPSIMSKYVGGAEERLRAYFKEAQENAPAIIFFDEIDAIAPNRDDGTNGVETRVVAQLLGLLDGLEARGEVIVIAATNRPNSIDPALRRPGRFDREIEIGVPDREGREEIMNIITRHMAIDENVNVKEIASLTHGFVGADISALVKESAIQSIRRHLPEIDLEEEEIPPHILEEMRIKNEDFENALKEVGPSAMREVFVEIPNVRWEDLGGLNSVKSELKKAIEWPLKFPETYDNLGIAPVKGVLLHGPPGTGKTMIAKAIANESEANFISIKGPELFSKWLGESERAIKKLFIKARQTSPCIIFFDEIDAIASNRDTSSETTGAQSRVVNQLLTELDGMTLSQGVIFLAATNRISAIDPALLRSGRVDKIIYMGNPDRDERLNILEIIAKRVKLSEGVCLEEIATKTEDFSGADLSALIQEAGLIALERDRNVKTINQEDIEQAYEKIIETKEQKQTTENNEYNYVR